MKTRILFFFLFICFFYLAGNSQKENWKWYFGNGCGLDFCSNPPTVLTDGVIQTFEGCSSISDANGNLLFYSNGETIWNKMHIIMDNGDSLKGNISASQSCLIVQKPGSNNYYYIFTLKDFAYPDGLRYSIVDMNLAASNGSVVAKNVVIQGQSSEQLAAVRHDNGADVWIISHDIFNNTFMANLLTSSGLNTVPVLSSIGSTVSFGSGTVGYLKVSPNRKKIVFGFYKYSSFELFDFNATTGVLSNSVSLSNNGMAAYGCEFSPDNKKLYGSSWEDNKIYQWNLDAGSNSAIMQSKIAIYTSTTTGFSALQLAPNGKIYVARFGSQSLGVIHSPNTLGANCNYIDGGQQLGTGVCRHGLPNNLNSNLLPSEVNVTGPTVLCSGETETLSVTGANSYTWNGNALSPSIIISPTTTSHYSVTGNGNYGCHFSMVATVIVLPCTSIHTDNLTNKINAFPNPTQESIELTLYGQSAFQNKEIKFKILNYSGKEVKQGLLVTGKPLKIWVDDLNCGIYYLIISEAGQGVLYQKLIISR